MISEEQYKNASKQIEEAEKIIREYHEEKRKEFDKKFQESPVFTDDELIYSAYTICPCGNGLAYPRGCGPFHYWDCSAILKGVADSNVKHTDRLPFTFYEIKSEDQPSANGNTTRAVLRKK